MYRSRGNADKKKQGLWSEYRAAISEYHRLTNYLNASHDILTRHERGLLLDFVDLAKRRSALALNRLHRVPN